MFVNRKQISKAKFKPKPVYTTMKTLKMKNLFVLPNASSVYKELERTRKSGNLNENLLEQLLFKALFLLEETEAACNRNESALKWRESKPYWEGQK